MCRHCKLPQVGRHHKEATCKRNPAIMPTERRPPKQPRMAGDERPGAPTSGIQRTAAATDVHVARGTANARARCDAILEELEAERRVLTDAQHEDEFGPDPWEWVDTLTADAASSPLMQHAHLRLQALPAFIALEDRNLIAHIAGDANVMAGAASRGKI